jgi:uncharacterized protein (DUF433 family)
MRSTNGVPALADIIPLGIGYYALPEASRLLGTPTRSIARWLRGYSYRDKGQAIVVPPLWTPQLPSHDHRLELGFRDLVELRFIKAFVEAGLGLKTIRASLDYARTCVQDDRPFSTRRFRTDGKTIFLDSLRQPGLDEILDLRTRQFVFRQAVERTFKDLDIEDDAVARWRPFGGKPTIVIDPTRAFGQPIATHYGVPTTALADAVRAEGSVERVARLFEVATPVVRDAVDFEKGLIAA